MNTIERLKRWKTRQVAITRLNHEHALATRGLRPVVRRMILQEIYQQAAGRFPHYFDPVAIHRKLRRNRTPVPWDLFLKVVYSFGPSDKVRIEAGSFGNDHHVCDGRVRLPKVP